ncbi:alpha/beta hydrolase [Algirhabdus cladophorae]|uniref:alpha/beta hydrolase n=1 Tax=Algirhabdus cladophorae TaxID=3377108 RepID=UPI003B849E59
MAKLNLDLRIALEAHQRAMGGLVDFTQMPPKNGRRIELEQARNQRFLMPEVASAVEIKMMGADREPLKGMHIVPPHPRDGIILYFHGGGWAFGSHLTHEDPIRRLSLATSLSVLSISYRLAPEHLFPAGLNDCISVWRALSLGKIPQTKNTGPFILAGDSAGANLALAAMLNEVEAGNVLPDAALLFYGVYGADFDTPSYTRWASGPVLTRAKMQRFWDWYCPLPQRQDYLAAPLLAPIEHFRSLPELFISAAEIDPLLSDSEQLYRLLSMDPTRNDTFELWPGLAHGALGFAHRVDQVRDHLSAVDRWIQSRF